MTYEKIVVTGGAGRLGRFVVERLKARYDVKVIDIKPSDVPGVETVNIDVTDLAALTEAFKGADAVIHLAAVPNPRTSSPQMCFSVNTQGTWATLQAAEDANVKRVVVISSDSTTGLHYNPKNWAPQYLPVDENHPIRPSEVYSLSKEVTESIARCYSVRGKIEVLVVRPCHIVFAPEYPELGERGSDVNNYHYWGYVAPEDVAQGIQLALEHPDGRYDCFYLGAAAGLNERPTLELMRERLGYLPEIRGDTFERNPQAGVFGVQRARDVLGYDPKFTWRDFGTL